LKSNCALCLPGASDSGPSQRWRFKQSRFHLLGYLSIN
jgi:hypothetical protein